MATFGGGGAIVFVDLLTDLGIKNAYAETLRRRKKSYKNYTGMIPENTVVAGPFMRVSFPR
jgi:hypothetical protein